MSLGYINYDNPKIIIKENDVCRLKNGEIVRMKRNSLPWYKFSGYYLKSNFPHIDGEKSHEVWGENGYAYHSDCGYNVVEIIESSSTGGTTEIL